MTDLEWHDYLRERVTEAKENVVKWKGKNETANEEFRVLLGMFADLILRGKLPVMTIAIREVNDTAAARHQPTHHHYSIPRELNGVHR
ncbi:MAG TPA: hypothetical protein VHB50_06400 [Bryobacteraceae bacterium]|nr:hypothetical protein [Bryobacteraceae bacterium]